MKEMLKSGLIFISMFVVGMALMIAIVMLPMTYMSGQAKSLYMQQQKGYYMEWYHAAFLPNEVFQDINFHVMTGDLEQ